jgi:GT2 family glycosyltransferase
MPKILIAVPCLDTIDVEFVRSVMGLTPIGSVHLEFLPGNLVYVARDLLAAKAVVNKTDYVLWLDSDMVFDSDLLLRLWEHREKGIISGLYFRRRPPYNPVLYKELKTRNVPTDPESIEYDDYPEDQVFEAAGIGFGGVLVKTNILAEVINKYGTAFEPLHSFGEDLSFCIRAKELGYPSFCHSGIQLGHRSNLTVTEATFKAFNQARHELRKESDT